MLDQVIKERLELIFESIQIIESRVLSIQTARDFVRSDDSKTIMDSVAMRLQTIGENTKKISNIQPDFFEKVSNLDIDPIIRFRDFIAHHYEKTDYEIIFDICKHYLPQLKSVIKDILNSNSQ